MADNTSSIPTKNSPLEGWQMKSDGVDYPPSDLPAQALVEEGWVETTLGEVVEFVVDNRGKTPPLVENGYELLEVNAVSDNAREPDYSKVSKFVDEETFRNGFRKGTIKKGDVLIPTVGTIGNASYSKEERGAIAQNLIALRTNTENDSLFLYYFLTDPNTKKVLLNLDIGGVQPSIKVPHLLGMQVVIPTLTEQKAIASVLSAFDDKIELLREQNKTLEEMGQTIFKEWFGKYGVDDELPEGWRVFELSEIVNTVNGYAYRGSDLVENSDEALVTLKSFDRNGGFQTRGFKPFIGNPKETQEVKIGDLVVAHTDLTQDAEVLGNPAFIFDDGGFSKMFITMDLVKVVSKYKNLTNAFLYYLMKAKEFKGHCVGYSNGTTVLHLSKKAIPEYKIVLPEKFEVLTDISLLLKETTDKIADNLSQIQSLARSRDELLPKLISGVVRVNGFEN